MRTWCHRHPNAVVVALLAAWMLNAHYAWEGIQEGGFLGWFLFASCSAVAVFLADRIKEWWRRT